MLARPDSSANDAQIEATSIEQTAFDSSDNLVIKCTACPFSLSTCVSDVFFRL